MNRLLIVGTLAVVVVLAAASAQSDRGGPATIADQIAELVKAVERLEMRVERLEARRALESPGYLEEMTGDEEDERGVGQPGRVMRLDGIEPVEASPEAYAEIERLRDEVAALERTVERQQRRTTSASGSGSRGGRGGYRSGRGSYNDPGPGRQRRAEGELLAEYTNKLRKKEGELKRLEREVEEPRQIVIGSFEGVIITLRTTRDLSRQLDRVEAGGLITWDGRRVRQDATSQEWVVSRIEPVN